MIGYTDRRENMSYYLAVDVMSGDVIGKYASYGEAARDTLMYPSVDIQYRRGRSKK